MDWYYSTVPFSKLAEWDSPSRVYKKPGIAYLFFAARGAGDARERSAISARSTFELELTLRAGVRDKGALTKACAALWLLTHLGGLGLRARRGAGSLQVTRIIESEQDWKETGLPPLEIRARTTEELQKELEAGLTALRELSKGWIRGTAPSLAPPSNFDVLHPEVCKIWVLKERFDSWQEALEFIGLKMKEFRRKRPPDYGNVKTALRTGTLKGPVERAAFGLPIVFYYRSLGGINGILAGESHDRRASPLLVRVTCLAGGKYALILTFFHAHLLKPGEKLKLKQSGPPALTKPPDFEIIRSFVSDVGSCLKVI